MRRAFVLAGTFCLAVVAARAQDPVKVDPRHYTIEAENDQVRVLRFKEGPHEKTSMHSHPAAVVVLLTDSKTRFTFPDGKTTEREGKAGSVILRAAETHAGENLGDKPVEIIIIELKGKAAAKPAAAKAPAAKKKS